MCTNKGKNMIKITIMVNDSNLANSNFAACNVNQFHAKLEGALYERVAVPTAIYRIETWSIAVAEKKRLYVIDMRCMRSMYGVTRMDSEK